MASYDVARPVHQSLMDTLMDSARHAIKRILNPRCLSWMACYDEASTIHQSLFAGAHLPFADDDLLTSIETGTVPEIREEHTKLSGRLDSLWGQADIARHFVCLICTLILWLNDMAAYDVASNICQALTRGVMCGARDKRRGRGRSIW